jgi:FMN phosphatase YigB (HAD superfamily)
VSLRIGFDLDGVLADMESELVRQAELLFGEAMTRRLEERAIDPNRPASTATEAAAPESIERGGSVPGKQAAADSQALPLVRLKMTSRQQRKLWRHVESIENFWETLAELEPGVIRRLAATARERRWEIIFLTKRPETAGSTAQVQSQRWLESKGFALPSVFVVQGSRGRIAASLDLQIVVDDRPENCLDVATDSKTRAILIWRRGEQAVPPSARRHGIGVVRSVSDCLDVLVRADSRASEKPGMKDRVKRLLGLKEAARG